MSMIFQDRTWGKQTNFST